jgi:uncharacterized protein (DUF302 family)
MRVNSLNKTQETMENEFVKIIIRIPFDRALARLQQEVAQEGFEVPGITNFQRGNAMPVQVTSDKYTVITLYHPLMYKEMMELSPFEGIILPCFVSVVEVHPEETAIVLFNATRNILEGIHSPQLIRLAEEVSHRIDRAIRIIGKDTQWAPDLTTSWS